MVTSLEGLSSFRLVSNNKHVEKCHKLLSEWEDELFLFDSQLSQRP